MIPALDLRASYRAIGPELEDAALRVLRSGRYILGEEVAAFEAEFASFCGARHVVGVDSGTSALHLALRAAGIGPGDEVITVPMTFVATVAAILCGGARPVFVDIDPHTWTLDAALLELAITPRTKAVVPVHLHGRMADMVRICEIARRNNLLVIEDAAQSHGAQLQGRAAGTYGDLGCFSFYPGKNLGACGDAGAVATDRADLAHRIRVLRDWGQEKKYVHATKGFNNRLDEIQAALLRVKLPHLERWTEARRRIAAEYDAGLAGLPLTTPVPGAGKEHVYHVYAIRVTDRDRVARRLAEQGVQTNIHYPSPVHLQPAYKDLGYEDGAFPAAEAMARECLSLPIYPEMSEQQVATVCAAVADCFVAAPGP
jgi:dTDP-4-amino-4,6-dideoxygalactose transaminase